MNSWTLNGEKHWQRRSVIKGEISIGINKVIESGFRIISDIYKPGNYRDSAYRCFIADTVFLGESIRTNDP